MTYRNISPVEVGIPLPTEDVKSEIGKSVNRIDKQ